jgi:hypothetical protein
MKKSRYTGITKEIVLSLICSLNSISVVLREPPSKKKGKLYRFNIQNDKCTNTITYFQLFSEIKFLTLYGEKDKTCIYAGAAPGTHIKYLSSLFSDIKFVLLILHHSL